MDFGTNLKRILDSRGITQKAFAEMTGKEAPYISKIINNRYNVSWDMIMHFADAVKIKPSAFFEEGEVERELLRISLNELDDDLKDFIRQQPNAVWLHLARDLSTEDLSPESIKQIVRLFKEADKSPLRTLVMVMLALSILRPLPALPWGSKSTNNVFFFSAHIADKLIALVVLPVPPF